jgi:hypothetical protein
LSKEGRVSDFTARSGFLWRSPPEQSQSVFRLRGGELKRGGKREILVAEKLEKGFEKQERPEPFLER